MTSRKLSLVIVTTLCLLLIVTGCNLGSNTRVITPPELEITVTEGSQVTTVKPQTDKGAYVGTGIYPARYEIGNPSGYTKGLTIDMEFEIFNGLPFSSPIDISIAKPSQSTMNKRIGFAYWDDVNTCVSIIDNGQDISAYGSKTFMVRIYVPQEMTPPDKWIFHIRYFNAGQLWGMYTNTESGNFIFYPASFRTDNLSDQWQEMSLLTWGNSPRLMIRAAYNNPPENINDGRLVYLGLGEQVIKKWLDPDSGKLLDRQYTLFSITDNQTLETDSETRLFYRAWIEHRGVDGLPDGNWDAIGQSMAVQVVSAEVLVTMK